MYLAVVLCLVASAIALPASEAPPKGVIDYEVPIPLGYPAPVLRSNVILNDHVVPAPFIDSLGAPVVIMEKQTDEAEKHEGTEKPADGEHKPALVRVEDPRTPFVRSGIFQFFQNFPFPIKFPEVKWPSISGITLPWSASRHVYAL